MVKVVFLVIFCLWRAKKHLQPFLRCFCVFEVSFNNFLRIFAIFGRFCLFFYFIREKLKV
jgi:hypothetical protein